MIQLVDQDLVLLLGAFLMGDVDQHVDGAADLAGRVAQRRRIRHERDPHPVGTFGHRLHAPHRLACRQGHRHGALLVRQPGSIGVVDLPGDAPAIAAENRFGAGQLRRGAVVEGDPALGVGRVDGGRQGVEQLARPPLMGLQILGGAPERSDVLQAPKAADDLAGPIEQGVDVGDDSAARSVGALDDHLVITDRRSRPEDLSHRGVLGGQRRTVRRIDPERSAVAEAGVPDGGNGIPELRRATIELDQDAVVVTGIDGDGELLEQTIPGVQRLLQGQGHNPAAAVAANFGTLHTLSAPGWSATHFGPAMLTSGCRHGSTEDWPSRLA